MIYRSTECHASSAGPDRSSAAEFDYSTTRCADGRLYIADGEQRCQIVCGRIGGWLRWSATEPRQQSRQSVEAQSRPGYAFHHVRWRWRKQ